MKLAVEATTDAGVLSVDHGKSGQLAGWHVDNIYSVWKSGSMTACTDDNPGYASLITVLGPSPINSGP